jgi:hypothetical protein
MASHDDTLKKKKSTKVDQVPEHSAPGETENGSHQLGDEKKKAKAPYANHGVFSRNAWKALASTGEDIKTLGQTERMLQEHFRPRNQFEESALDRAWSRALRCVLVAREEQ